MKTTKIQILLGHLLLRINVGKRAGVGSECFEVRHPDACDPGAAKLRLRSDFA